MHVSMCVFRREKRLISKLAEFVRGKSVFVLCSALMDHLVVKRPHRAALPPKSTVGLPEQSPEGG